ncbi:MAG TPA: hypothetical protein VG845_11440 [Dehalococcoidia bacterium]|jgi:hypothetical protein|nr:hypothetical protein [Dehalococcoidia bacterium]
MAKFMLLYHAPVSAEAQMANATPEQMEAGMKPWMDWFGKVGSGIVDGGSPLGHSTSVGGNNAGSDIAGYSIIEAPDMGAAEGLVGDHPHLMLQGGRVEILEIMPMPGM